MRPTSPPSPAQQTPTKYSAGVNNANPESPTTARPLDFDDEPQETGVISTPSKADTTAPAADDVPPPKPPRPLSPRQQAEETLKEAFPSIDAAVVRAVLTASGYNVERAFHALLGMTDPTAQEELPPPPPAKPPRPSYHPATSTTQKQLHDDELYARQLAQHFSGSARQARPGYSHPEDEYPEERERNFFDDDLPVIRENIRKGFLETQSKVNTWVQNFKKRLDGDEDEAQPEDSYARPHGETQTYGRVRRSGDSARRSGDLPPPRPPRPLANIRPANVSRSQERRKVSFQDGPPEEIDNLYDAPETTKRIPSTGGKASKWQPLSTTDHSSVGENDPFSLGDSEDERDNNTKPKDGQTDQLKQLTTDAMESDIGSGSKEESKKAEDK
ncbi:hypothetical protein UA08_05539 [Talaromyces atroroseus]|uniref:CUE domain-containing protein n=1 Tax=Talaromyces atroroseus TaxID=1441469 RepID=A0A225ACY7_TALAT|nr:hypothetical protein UA08_05539 [Talaromyces atroroseus]OKL59021.1 hypothetical protein UA08_05539 [Talaromyces atroroseus]